MRSTGLLGCSITESDGLVSPSFASLGDLQHVYPTSPVGIVPISPVTSTLFDLSRTMQTIRLVSALCLLAGATSTPCLPLAVVLVTAGLAIGATLPADSV